jgi:Lar family restriction alleviation protein
MPEQIKPCPFCGSEAKIQDAFYDCMHYWVQCTNDDCKAQSWSQEDSPDGAIERWNRRTPVEECHA